MQELQPGARGRRRGSLDRERILATALALLEREGERALSMRRVAAALGTGPMSLYRHVRDKADLLDGVGRLALGGVGAAIPAEGPWPDRVLAWMGALRRELLHHPAVVPLLRAEGVVLPALLTAQERLLEILHRAGLEHERAAAAGWEILWFTMGFVVTELRAGGRVRGAGLARPTFSAVANRVDELPKLARSLEVLQTLDGDTIFARGARHLVSGMARELEASPERF